MECSLCHKPIDQHDPTTWKAVIGWVGGPKKDSMRLRQDFGLFAHDACIGKLMAGQPADQPNLFEVAEVEPTTSQPYTSADSFDFLDDVDTAESVPMVPVNEDDDIWPAGPPIERRPFG